MWTTTFYIFYGSCTAHHVSLKTVPTTSQPAVNKGNKTCFLHYLHYLHHRVFVCNVFNSWTQSLPLLTLSLLRIQNRLKSTFLLPQPVQQVICFLHYVFCCNCLIYSTMRINIKTLSQLLQGLFLPVRQVGLTIFTLYHIYLYSTVSVIQ